MNQEDEKINPETPENKPQEDLSVSENVEWDFRSIRGCNPANASDPLPEEVIQKIRDNWRSEE